MRTETMTAMKRRFVKAVLAASLAVAAMSGSREARAQEIQVTGPLKGAPAVRHMRLYRKGRFEFAPTASFTLLDEYRRTLLAGARLNYYLTDWLGIGVWGAGGVWSETTTLTNEVNQYAPRNVETVINVNHTGGCPGGNCSSPTPGASPSQIGSNASFATAGQTKITWTFGVDLTFWPSNLVSFGIEYRALPFYWNPAGFDTRGGGPNGNYPDNQVNSSDDTFKFNQLVTLAVGFSFPAPKINE